MRDNTSKSLTVKFMYSKQYSSKIDTMIELLKNRSNLTYSVTPLHDKTDKKLFAYNEEDKKYFKLKGKV